jgi:hypothetical protein
MLEVKTITLLSSKCSRGKWIIADGFLGGKGVIGLLTASSLKRMDGDLRVANDRREGYLLY